VGGDCLPYSSSGNAPADTIQCPGGVVDDCSECTNLEINIVVRPVCLTPATALSCNLINGYFVPESSVIPPQTPCDICDGLDACQPFEFGTCCNEFSGECFGITTKVQCDVFSGKWTPNVEDCDICCPQKEYRGACCLCVDQCIDDITPQQCSAVNGLFMGDESQCESVSCYQAGACDCGCVEDGFVVTVRLDIQIEVLVVTIQIILPVVTVLIVVIHRGVVVMVPWIVVKMELRQTKTENVKKMVVLMMVIQ